MRPFLLRRINNTSVKGKDVRTRVRISPFSVSVDLICAIWGKKIRLIIAKYSSVNAMLFYGITIILRTLFHGPGMVSLNVIVDFRPHPAETATEPGIRGCIRLEQSLKTLF